MSTWAVSLYGDPCRECGFAWSTPLDKALALVADVPVRIRELVRDREAGLRHPDLAWSMGEYVCHVADNLRIYAERFAGINAGSIGPLAPYDQDALAHARRYDLVPLESSLWALEQSAREWCETARTADPEIVVSHPERGPQTVLDLVMSSAHDAYHHVWDIERIVSSQQPLG